MYYINFTPAICYFFSILSFNIWLFIAEHESIMHFLYLFVEIIFNHCNKTKIYRHVVLYLVSKN